MREVHHSRRCNFRFASAAARRSRNCRQSQASAACAEEIVASVQTAASPRIGCPQRSTCSAGVATIAAKTMAKQLAQKKKASSESDGLPRRLLASLRRETSIRAGDRVGVAVSGGADSVALLLLLLAIRERLGIVLVVVHFN